MPNINIKPTVFNARLIHSTLQLVQHHGLNPAEALDHCGIKSEDINNPNTNYPVEVFSNFLNFLNAKTNNTKMITLAAEALQPRMLGSLGFVVTTANTFQEAYLKLETYFPLIFEGINIATHHNKDDFTLTLDFDQDNLLIKEFFVCCLLNWPRWLTGRNIPAHRVTFDQPEDKSKGYIQQLATHIEYSQPKIQITFNNQYINIPCLEANKEMHQLHCNFADTLMHNSSHKYAIVSQTKSHIRQMMNNSDRGETFSIKREQIAQNLNMSLRTFQRKLSTLDTNFQNIYDSVRKETCLQLLSQPDISLGQIAYKLGYANLSAFQKAFRRWLGVPPSEYKKNNIPYQTNTHSTSSHAAQHSQWFDNLSPTEIQLQIRGKLKELSSFSLELLCLSALLTRTENNSIPIETLASIINNSTARTNIYLWPLQQHELIKNIDNKKDDIAISLTHEMIISEAIDIYSQRQISSFHYSIAKYYQNRNLIYTLNHYKECLLINLEDTELKVIFAFCHQQSKSTENKYNYNLQDDLFKIMIEAKELLSDDDPLLNDLRIKQLSIWHELSLFNNVTEQYQVLKKKPLEQTQYIDLVITTSKSFIESGCTTEAINLLQTTSSLVFEKDELKHDLNTVLLNVSEQVNTLITRQKHYGISSLVEASSYFGVNKEIEIKLRILQCLTAAYLQNHKIIAAAGTITKMFSLTLTSSEYYFSSFAAAHFSWVICNFVGDIKTTSLCKLRATTLAAKHSKRHLEICESILFNQVEHWLISLPIIKKELSKRKVIANTTHKNKLQINILSIYLSLCSGEPLQSVKKDCQNLTQHVDHKIFPTISQQINNLVKTINSFESKQKEPILHFSRYESSTYAFNILFKAFYNFEYSLWPSLQFWDASIESNISNEYIVTEAVFICSIMRLYLEENPKTVSKSRYEGDLARIQSWRDLCPDNYSTQYSILSAIFHDKFGEPLQSFEYFETTNKIIDRYGYLHHKILYYHFYAIALDKKFHTLSSLCKEKENSLKQEWFSR